ncbi:predicted protein [Aspergillus terreus NIH2624]|uniref:Uncharacterized protein n=1 Tax=Aspergillus terreus (strain NIH 2624 / FGSC A1156) TaxID=341663 RepID=Q0CB08_ASPTN|nr:uncharacterized protein ATEG_09126 [Aspergillus terreus NIH2624]EAU30263.1 predicted protein [Aspergillus terreus NIH2624]
MPVSGPVRLKMHHFSLTHLPGWVQIITLAIWPHRICSGLTWTRLVRDNNGVRHQEPSTWSITQKDDQTVAMMAGELTQQINVAGDPCPELTCPANPGGSAPVSQQSYISGCCRSRRIAGSSGDDSHLELPDMATNSLASQFPAAGPEIVGIAS